MNTIEINVMKKNKFLTNILSATVLASLLSFFTTAYAGPGHDHGDHAPAAVMSKALPRVVMESELFEAVGILNGRLLTIYIDHAATNAPVQNAKLELELNGQPVPVALHSEGKGELNAQLPDGIEKGVVAVSMTVSAGEEMDLLAGELVTGHHNQLAGVEGVPSRLWTIVLYGVGGLLILILLVIGSVRLKSKGEK